MFGNLLDRAKKFIGVQDHPHILKEKQQPSPKEQSFLNSVSEITQGVRKKAMNLLKLSPIFIGALAAGCSNSEKGETPTSVIENDKQVPIELNLPKSPINHPNSTTSLLLEDYLKSKELTLNKPSLEGVGESKIAEVDKNYKNVEKIEQPEFHKVTATFAGKGPAQFIQDIYGIQYSPETQSYYQHLVGKDGSLVKNPNKDFKLGGAYFLADSFEAAEKLALKIKTGEKNQVEEVVSEVNNHINLPEVTDESEKDVVANTIILENIPESKNRPQNHSTEQSTEALSSRLERHILTNAEIQKPLFRYGKARNMLSLRGSKKNLEDISNKDQQIIFANTLSEFKKFKERMALHYPQNNESQKLFPKQESFSDFFSSITASDYRLAVLADEASVRPILSGSYDYKEKKVFDINTARKAYQEEQSEEYDKSINVIVERAVGPAGDSGNYRFIYAAVIDQCNNLGANIKETKDGAEITIGTQTYFLIKDSVKISNKIKKISEEGIKSGWSDQKINTAFAEYDIRFNDEIMGVLTESIVIQAYTHLKNIFGEDLSKTEQEKLAKIAHNTGMKGMVNITRNYLQQSKYVDLDNYMYSLMDSKKYKPYAHYYFKVNGLLELAALEKKLSSNNLINPVSVEAKPVEINVPVVVESTQSNLYGITQEEYKFFEEVKGLPGLDTEENFAALIGEYIDLHLVNENVSPERFLSDHGFGFKTLINNSEINQPLEKIEPEIQPENIKPEEKGVEIIKNTDTTIEKPTDQNIQNITELTNKKVQATLENVNERLETEFKERELKNITPVESEMNSSETKIVAKKDESITIEKIRSQRNKTEYNALNKAIAEVVGQDKEAEFRKFLKNNAHVFNENDSVLERVARIIFDQTQKIFKLKEYGLTLEKNRKILDEKIKKYEEGGIESIIAKHHQKLIERNINSIAKNEGEIKKMEGHIELVQTILPKAQEILAADDYDYAVAA